MAVEAGRIEIWDVDLRRDVVTETPELNRLLGFPEDEPLDHGAIRAGYAPGELERMQAEGLAALQRGETSIENVFQYLRPDLEPRWLHPRCELVFDDAGAPVKAIGVLFYETARHRAAEDLRASEARF